MLGWGGGGGKESMLPGMGGGRGTGVSASWAKDNETKANNQSASKGQIIALCLPVTSRSWNGNSKRHGAASHHLADPANRSGSTPNKQKLACHLSTHFTYLHPGVYAASRHRLGRR